MSSYYDVQDPTRLTIPPGLTTLPRQIGLFAAFRSALLSEAGAQAPLAGWRGRDADDFGIMLLEMWAYVCDVLSFYDAQTANESYLRTAARAENVARLVNLLGYVPHPAVGALVDLGVTLSGDTPVTLPVGTAFRSGAFGDEAPQVFELTAAAVLHPANNPAPLEPVATPGVGAAFGETGSDTVTLTHLYLERGTVTLQANDRALVTVAGASQVSRVTAVSTVDVEGDTYTQVTFDPALSLAADTLPGAVTVRRPASRASLWSVVGVSGNPDAISGSSNLVYLDGLYRAIQPGDEVILSKGGEDRWYEVIATHEERLTLSGASTTTATDEDDDEHTIDVPAITAPVTRLTLDTTVDGRKASGAAGWTAADAAQIVVHYGLANAGAVAEVATGAITPDDALQSAVSPPEGYEPGAFLITGADGTNAYVTGTVDDDGLLQIDPATAWEGSLASPLTLYSNVVRASRGETVSDEVLGSGDASQASQSFTLKKKPLTYLPDPSAPGGVRAELEVRVNGVLWDEVPTLYGQDADATVYTVRLDEEGAATITFGDGERGARLPTGSNNVTASYRFGAGAASPPAGSISQLVNPVTGLSSVTNPIPAYGGADAEDTEDSRRYAPRSALMLGRAVSLLDYEAAAASVSGVTAAQVTWRWSDRRQRPVVQVWYIGAASLTSIVLDTLQRLSDPATPFDVDQALAVPVDLTLAIEVNDRYRAEDVIAGVVEVLTGDQGALLPQAVGIGGTVFRSQIFAVVSAVDGVDAVMSILWNGVPLSDYGKQAAAGTYFTFNLTVNGEGDA